ncbi:TonB-dependent hemoglobin/transferrin/lactoferrin family receptor [Paraglaciecola aquimarina]|uniref:TonB-dependent hemoglobin/transferrin/lactoferrin family receptor n=1 Tax=Paraglaciecola aquimarina TaxID=1235557 RepID=A0ABU3T088_9ALTE|nr:TonB-dependent hemoglobin/transferrin/lactoferrin family receptor [Paraglaciecola aquimarina]MDU0355675.1 TonB-dependent hemoglobin/transferrin/lactoferrin family receptor [Paraglaciecola aquimarina]
MHYLRKRKTHALQKTLLAAALATLLSPTISAQVSLEKTKVGSQQQSNNKQNIQVLDADTVDSQMITDINDTVRYISGVSVNNTGNRFGDNGFNIRGMEGDAVAITLDGLSQGESLNPTTFSRYGMYSSTRNAIEPESVKSIEIVKGASSILAGSGALGGAVMYTTKDASDFLPATGNATAGNVKLGFDGRNNETLASLAVANRTGNFEGLLIFTQRDGNETSAHGNGADIEGAERGQADAFEQEKQNVLVKLSYHLSEQQELGVVFENFESQTLGTPLSRQSASYYDFNNTDDSDRERIGLFYKWQANNGAFDNLELTLNQQEIYTTGITAFSFGSGDTAYLRVEDRNYTQELTNFNLDLAKSFHSSNTSHDLIYGLTTQSTEVENHLQDVRYNGLTKDTGLRNGYPIVDPSWVPKTDSDTWTLYAQDTISLNQQFTITAGLRYDDTRYSPQTDETFIDPTGSVKDAEFSALSGQLMVNYEFQPNHHFIASVGSGFKAPTTQQLYLNTNGSDEFADSERVVDPDTGSVSYIPNGRVETDLDTVTNPDLEAEESINYELAYQWNSDKGSLKLSAFRSDYSNMIININQSRNFATPITSATLNTRVSGCNDTIIGDECWTVSQVTEDTWGVPTNTGEITVEGFELDATWNITPQWYASLSHSHTSGEYNNTVVGNSESNVNASFEKGDPLESIAPDNTVVGLNYHSGDYNWGLSSYARLIDGKDQDDSYTAVFYSDSATVIDIMAWYNVSDNLKLRANVTNLFDEEYSLWQKVRNVREGSGGFFGGVTGDGIDRYSEPGRQFAVTMTYTF